MVSGHTTRTGRSLARSAVRIIAAMAVLLLSTPGTAHASLLSPEMEDKLATGIAIFAIFFVPVVLIVAFWLVHILPEQIAHKRNHPQFEAIRTLCLLSLVFGGLLWPIAWLWAYSKPVLHKMAYGTDKLHPDDEGLAAGDGSAGAGGLHERLARLEARDVTAAELKTLRSDLEALEAKFVDHGAP